MQYQRYLQGFYLLLPSVGTILPLLRADAVLQIPQIGMNPKLEEIQQGVTVAADYVLQVMYGVSQWSKDRVSKVWAHF